MINYDSDNESPPVKSQKKLDALKLPGITIGHSNCSSQKSMNPLLQKISGSQILNHNKEKSNHSSKRGISALSALKLA